jgi:hypothetical protein
VIRHVVVFKWIPEATTAQRDAVVAGLSALPAVIPEIAAYSVGHDLGLTDGAWDLAVVADFAGEDDWRTYRDHPAHRAVIDERIEPIRAEIVRVQFEPTP